MTNGGDISPCLEGQGLPTFTSRLSCFAGGCAQVMDLGVLHLLRRPEFP
jgi:hypothetical protein